MLCALVTCVLAVLMIAPCPSDTVEIGSLKLDSPIVSASLCDEQSVLGVLETDGVRWVSLDRPVSSSEPHNLPETNAGVLVAGRDSVWIGGGEMAAGWLLEVDRAGAGAQLSMDSDFFQVYSLALSQSERLLAVGHANGGISVWETANRHKILSLGEYDSEVFALTFGANEHRLLSGSGVGSLVLWDADNGKKIKSARVEGDSIFTIAFHARTDTVVTGGGGGVLRVWDTELKLVHSLDLGREAILCCATRESDGRIACGLTGGYVVLVNRDGSDRVLKRLHDADVAYVVFVDGGTQLVTVATNGAITIWQVDRGISSPPPLE